MVQYRKSRAEYDQSRKRNWYSTGREGPNIVSIGKGVGRVGREGPNIISLGRGVGTVKEEKDKILLVQEEESVQYVQLDQRITGTVIKAVVTENITFLTREIVTIGGALTLVRKVESTVGTRAILTIERKLLL